MKSMKRLITILIPIVLLLITNSQVFPKVPLPDDIKISEPTSELPKEAANLLGKWSGIWWSRTGSVSWAATLVVEEIKGEKAQIVYAWERNDRIALDGGWDRREANFDPKTLTIFWQHEQKGLKFSFTLKGKTLNGLLEGKYTFDCKMKKEK